MLSSQARTASTEGDGAQPAVAPRGGRLEEIWEFTAKRWSREQANRYIRTLQTAMERISEHPLLGKSRDEIKAGYRSFHAASHIIFYRKLDEGILVVRILHQSMDVERRF
jgi:toxin ParE1/3/4